MQYKTKKWVEMRFERDTRYYLLMLKQDLFGQWIITKVNGQINNQLGKSRDERCETYDEALARFTASIQYRLKSRNYWLVHYKPKSAAEEFIPSLKVCRDA